MARCKGRILDPPEPPIEISPGNTLERGGKSTLSPPFAVKKQVPYEACISDLFCTVRQTANFQPS